MKALLAIGTAFFILGRIVSCDSGKPVAPEVSRLYGSWAWLKSVGGFAGEDQTPQSTGHTAMVFFHEDGIARFVQDDSLVSKYRYTLKRERPHPGAEEAFVIEFLGAPSPRDRETVSYQGADTLFLTDVCIDCYQHVYVRLQH